MNQEKIGKFIQELRKEKNMTQQELGELLGVTDRSISNWENGKYMPDLSLFKPICDTLDININELLSGERITDNYEKKLEENIINTINYSNKKSFDKTGYLIFNSLGIILFLISCLSWSIPGNFQIIGCLGGILFIVISINKIFDKKTHKIIISVIASILLLFSIFITDYVMTNNYNYYPKIYLSKYDIENATVYKLFTKSVIYCNGEITAESINNRLIPKEEAIETCKNYLNK